MTETKSSDDGKRQALLDASRELFLKNSYNNISIRKIADRAQVNSALIGYYFGSKSGLFREMLGSYLNHNLDRLEYILDDLNHESLNSFFLNFYRSVPAEFTHLILRTVLYERNDMRDWIMDTIFKRVLQLALKTSRQIGDKSGKDYDPHLIRTVIQSMLVMPKVLQPMVEELEPGRINDEFYEQLAELNSQLLTKFFGLEK
ncbi:TetR/AcrR family transcriptional regulator [Vibrio sp. RC27]